MLLYKVISRVSGENVGPYAIEQNNLSAGSNYTIAYVGDDFAITAKPITVTADASQTKEYGTADASLTYTVSPGLKSGDSFTGDLSRVAGENVGPYAIEQNNLSAGSNYTIAYVGVDFAITAKPITVTADASQTKEYGTSDASLTYSVSPSLVGIDAFTGDLSRVSGENVGPYAIEQNNLSAGSNYTIAYVGDDFSITAKPITVTADASQAKEYGTSDATLTYSVSPSLKSGDSFTGDLSRVSGENVGPYAIEQNNLSAGSNYTIAYVGDDFAITAKPITVTANASQTKVLGTTDPTFAYTASEALANGNAFSGCLSRVNGENVGTYDYTLGSLSAGSNYNIILNNTTTFTITVNNVNETPTDIALSNSSIDENVTANSVVGSLSSTDVDSGDTFTYSLASGVLDNNLFSISGNDLTINASPDFETKSSYVVRVVTTDQGGLTFEKEFTITVNDIDESLGDIVLSTLNINENVAMGTVVGALSSIGEVTGNVFTYQLVSGADDNGVFGISGTDLIINTALDFETKNSYSVVIRKTNQFGATFEKQFTITVNNVNETPTDIALSNSVIDENVTANSVVGSLSSTDVDSGDTFTYSLASGVLDNNLFSISGNDLTINASPDFETKSSYVVRVVTTDQGGLTFEKEFTITVNDINESPTVIAITVTATPSQTKVYGQNDPVFTYTVAPALLSGDTFTGSLARASGENVGKYAIGQGTLNAGSNYSISYVTADFTITKADQVITWNQTLVSNCDGASTSVLTANSTSGLAVNYVSSNPNVATILNDELIFNNAGSATITASQLGNNNYNVAEAITLPVVNSQSNLIKKQFDDVIFFDNSSKEFKSYTWYKDGVLVTGQTLQYYKETGGLNGMYHAVATKLDGTVITSCPLTLSSTVTVETVKIVPNPARSNASYQLITNIDSAKMKNAQIEIFSMNGALLDQRTTSENETTLQAPSVEGVYVIRMTLSNGKTFTKNLLVKD